ncbi:MAG: ATP-binding protein [Candidatus Paceibacterota bacterium]|jgi:PAS domain S-box-containing protein
MTLRTKAIIFFGTLLISIVLVDVFYVQYGVRDTFVNQTTINFRIIAEQTESAFLAFSEEMKTRTIDWSSDSTLRNLAKETLDAKADTALRTQLAQQFAKYVNENKMQFDETIILTELLDKDGTVIAATDPKRVGVNDVTDGSPRIKQQFSKVIASDFGSAFVSSAVLDKNINSKPTSRVAVRIFVPDKNGIFQPHDGVLLLYFLNTERIISILNGGTDPEADRLSNMALLSNYKTAEIFFVNSDYVVVTPLRDVVEVVDANNLRAVVNTLPVSSCLQEGKEVSQEYDNAQGERVLGASMCLEERSVVLVLEIEKSEIFAPLDTLIKWTTLGVVAMLILGVIIIVLFVRWPLVHLGEIIKALEKVMNGDLNVFVKIDANDETGRLAQMFNTMIDSIRKNQSELQESKRQLEEKAGFLEKDLGEHEKQEKFLEESKRATLNLLEDSWKAKEKIEEEGSKLQTILSSIGDGLILIDNEYKITLINTKGLEIFGMLNENVVGKDLHDVMKLYKNNKDVLADQWPTEEVFKTKIAITTTVEEKYSITTSKLDVMLPVSFSFAPISGRFSGIVIVFRDVTADREFDEAKSGFISVASHQLRTPLTSIRWYSEMLLSEDTGPLNDSQKDFVGEIHGGAERLYKTVDLLLGLSRVEGGKLRIEKVPVSLTTLTSDILKEVTSQAGYKNIALNVHTPEGAPIVVWLDSLILRQVILNLLANSISYTNDNGLVDLSWSLREGGREVMYSVRDNGIGIPDNQKGRIFSKFFRAENARTLVPDGSGLGLALVKNLVESWGGQIWFESEQNKGSTFFFTIPLTTKVEPTVTK